MRDLARALRRHCYLALLVFGLTTLGALAGAWWTPDQYEARMKFLVKNTRADLLVTPDQDNGVANPNEITETQLNSEAELMKSQDILEQIVNDQKLSAAGTPSAKDAAVRKLEKNLAVAPLKKANLIEVKYAAESAQQAAAVLRQLGQLYLDKHLQAHRPAGTYEFFQTQTQDYTRQLRAAEAKLEDFRRRHNVVALEQQKSIGLQRLSDTQGKLRDADGMLNEAGKRIEVLSQQLGRAATRIPTQQRTLPNQFTTERLTTLLVELRNRRAQLLTKFQPGDRLVTEVDEQIRLTGEELERARRTTALEQATDVNPLRQSLEAGLTDARVEQAGRQALRANLSAQTQVYRQQVAGLENATRVHEDLTRQVLEAKENYQLYARKQEEARIADELDEKQISNVVIAEPARVPVLPARPNRPLIVLTGLILGLFLSVGSAVSLEFLRDTVSAPEELERLSGYPVLAILPKQPPRYLSGGPAATLTTGRVIAEINKPVTPHETANEDEPIVETPLQNRVWRSHIRSAITINSHYS